MPKRLKAQPLQTLCSLYLLICLLFSINSPVCHAQNTVSPKNVVIMIADGSGFNHLQAASLYQYGFPEGQLYEQFPVKLAMTNFSHGGNYDPQKAWTDFSYVLSSALTDSAASATAMSTGTKTFNGAIGLALDKSPLKHLLERAEDAGRSTGVVTTVQFSHSTPAGFVAHDISRENYEQIAQDMLLNSRLDVLMGCGHPLYNNDGAPKGSARDYQYVGGEALWKSLASPTKKIGGDADGDGVDDPWTLIESRQDFLSLTGGQTPKRVLGIPRVGTTLQQSRDGDPESPPYAVAFNQNVPSLTEMAAAALHILNANADGFVLIIEGGATDWAAHKHQINRLIEEQTDFDNAVYAVHQWIEQNSSWDETLLIVTADHETGYLTGPDSGMIGGQSVWNNLLANGAGAVPAVQWNTGGHSNALVPFFAKGYGSDLYLQSLEGEDPVYGPYIDNSFLSRILSWE